MTNNCLVSQHTVCRLDPAHHAWMTEGGAREIFAAIASAGGEARFVGGVVRDALLGRDIGDVDLAVNLSPAKVMAALKAAHIKVVPTGIGHGTVTAVAGRRGYEITTLRRDVETYGRHARVAYTGSWETDAARRDFTMNALYADSKGNVYDYGEGLEDLRHGCVRFIGDPEARLREDFLRLLRFFRFYAWFGRGKPDAKTLGYCKAYASCLRRLSVERIWKEIKRLLMAPDPVAAVDLMIRWGVMKHVLSGVKTSVRLRKMVALEMKHKCGPNPLRRLAALLDDERPRVQALADRLRLSNIERGKLAGIITMTRALKGRQTERSLRQALYTGGADCVRDALLLRAARGGTFDLAKALAVVAGWAAPVFPVQGRDLVKRGVTSGPRLGNLLRELKAWWIQHDFQPDRTACLKRLAVAMNRLMDA